MSEMNQGNNSTPHDLKRHQGELVISVALMAGSVWTFYQGIIMSIDIYRRVQPPIYTLPGVLPMIVSTLILLASIKVLRYAMAHGASFRALKSMWIKLPEKGSETATVTLVLGWMAIYVLVLIEYLPFEIATFVFTFVLMWLNKAATLWKMVVISLVFSVVVTYFFAEVVRTPFPHSFF